MSDTPQLTIDVCGPSTSCKCDCPRSCEHQWDGPVVTFENGGSSSCFKCGMLAIEHSMWVGP